MHSYCTQMWKKWHSYLHSNSKHSLLHSFFWRSNIGNCRETLWSNLITGRIIHQGKKAAKDVLQRFVCLMLSTFPFCTTAENVFFLESHSKGCFPPFFRSLSAIRRIVSFLLERRTEKSFSLMCHYLKINLIKGNYSG